MSFADDSLITPPKNGCRPAWDPRHDTRQLRRMKFPAQAFAPGVFSASEMALGSPGSSGSNGKPWGPAASVQTCQGQTTGWSKLGIFGEHLKKWRAIWINLGHLDVHLSILGGTTVFEPITRRAVATPHPSNQAPHAQSSASNNLRLSATTNRAPMISGAPLGFFGTIQSIWNLGGQSLWAYLGWHSMCLQLCLQSASMRKNICTAQLDTVQQSAIMAAWQWMSGLRTSLYPNS